MTDDKVGFSCLLRGIVYWEQMSEVACGSTSTLTVGARSLDELAEILAGALERFHTVVRWHSALHKNWAGRIQELRVRKVFASNPPGFEEVYTRDVDGIITNASRFVAPLSVTHLECLSDYRSTLLMLSTDGELLASEACDLMAGFVKDVTEDAIRSIREQRPDLVLGRVISGECTASVIQLLGGEGALRRVRDGLAESRLNDIGDLDQVAEWIGAPPESH